MLRLVDRLSAGEDVAVPTDQWGSPTYTDDLAGVTKRLVTSGATGTFHATGPQFLDRFALARMICDRFRLLSLRGEGEQPVSLGEGATCS